MDFFLASLLADVFVLYFLDTRFNFETRTAQFGLSHYGSTVSGLVSQALYIVLDPHRTHK